MRYERAVTYLVFAMIFIMGTVAGQTCERINNLPVQKHACYTKEPEAIGVGFPETHCVTSCVKKCVRSEPEASSL